MEKLRIDRPIIVEGKYDKIALSAVVEGVILTTGGFSLFNQKEKAANGGFYNGTIRFPSVPFPSWRTVRPPSWCTYLSDPADPFRLS